MEIGPAKRIIIVEPLELPEPLRQPEPVREPEKEPVHHGKPEDRY